jgi:hypothetical protein
MVASMDGIRGKSRELDSTARHPAPSSSDTIPSTARGGGTVRRMQHRAAAHRHREVRLWQGFQEERNVMSGTQAKTVLALLGGLYEENATGSMPPCMA